MACSWAIVLVVRRAIIKVLRWHKKSTANKELNMDINTINGAIMRGGYSNDDLNSIMDSVKYARSKLGRAKLRSFGVGDNVKFTSNRNGQVYKGVVEGVKIKNVIVNTAMGRFRVPANMLESA
jgi:hypothetical protein